MIKSLQMMNAPRKYEQEPWLRMLFRTHETNYNIAHLATMKDLSSQLVFLYTKRNLEILNTIVDNEKVDPQVAHYVEETLKWCEVAKTGNKKERAAWQKRGYDLFVHNLASAEIYREYESDPVVYTLIKTHGLIGQYLKGEVILAKNRPLYDLVKEGTIDAAILSDVLRILNQCIIGSLSMDLYCRRERDIRKCIDRILEGDFREDRDSDYLIRRIALLRGFLNEEEHCYLNDTFKNRAVTDILETVFARLEIWFFDSAFPEFTIEEQLKILLLTGRHCRHQKHVTFEKVMNIIYLDYHDRKTVNIYKKRIIETYLKELSLEAIVSSDIAPNPHITYQLETVRDTLIFTFQFSVQATKLIEFCEVAYTSNTLYQKAVFMLYDLLGFRRDLFDRFYNEIDYLNTMNSSLRHKAKILDFMVGERILDVGPGGGALMDLIVSKNNDLEVIGIDLSQNVIDTLLEKKRREKSRWNVVKGNALELDRFFAPDSIDTVIYSSIIHELYSYHEVNHRRFSVSTIKDTLTSGYRVLKPHGRIIIRDGIMTEPKDSMRFIEFKNPQDIEIVKRYATDFEGRKIQYEIVDFHTVKMPVNDAMEFLYTYTWGEDSYPLEVKEQFGYFTPKEYISFIENHLEHSKVIFCESFLQEGYETNLLNKITVYDESHHIVKLPDSTCIIVIEKEE